LQPVCKVDTSVGLIQMCVSGNIETGTRDTGTERWVAARKTNGLGGKETLASIVVVVVIVGVVIVAAKHETTQFQEDGPNLFPQVSLDGSRTTRIRMYIRRC
jgi:hypothetical protein